MTADPRVCVVVPAFDAMAFLPETIASVLAQTYSDYHVVVVDDGSTDGVAAWVEGLGRPEVSCVRQPNRGLASARNRGIAEGRGELVALLDADDLWHPSKLERQVAVMDAEPDAGLVHCGVRFVDQDGASFGTPIGVSVGGAVWDRIVVTGSKADVRCGSTPLVRRTCFEEVGLFDTSLTFSEDWDMWLRIASRFDFAAIDEPLVAYRQHRTNMTRGHTRIVDNQRRVLDKAFAAHPGASRGLRRRAYAQALVFASWRAHLAGDAPAAARHLGSSIKRDPRVLLRKNTVRLLLRLLVSGARGSGGAAVERADQVGSESR